MTTPPQIQAEPAPPLSAVVAQANAAFAALQAQIDALTAAGGSGSGGGTGGSGFPVVVAELNGVPNLYNHAGGGAPPTDTSDILACTIAPTNANAKIEIQASVIYGAQLAAGSAYISVLRSINGGAAVNISPNGSYINRGYPGISTGGNLQAASEGSLTFVDDLSTVTGGVAAGALVKYSFGVAVDSAVSGTTHVVWLNGRWNDALLFGSSSIKAQEIS